MTDSASLSAAELQILHELATRFLASDEATRASLQSTGVNVVPCNFYSTVPSVTDMDSSFELAEGAPYRTSSLFDDEFIFGFLEAIDRYADEFDPPLDDDENAPSGFFWNNSQFSYSDAMSYYCVIRHIKPKTVLEIGSGFSTLVARQALDKNGSGKLVIVEPYPREWLAHLDLELHRVPAQSLSPSFFNSKFADGDILFIDSTHTVKAGSDCLQIYLRILPALRAHLTIHVHDIYLPMPMPRHDFDRHIYWTEQYLLLAYLLDNPRTHTLFASRYLWRFHNEKITAFMRGRFGPGGASFWFHRRGRKVDTIDGGKARARRLTGF
jgi:hypothetical protein